MVLFKRLWQRVFVYALVLVVASGAMGIFLVHRNLTATASNVVLAFTGEIRNALRGQSPREAHALLTRFNTREARFWLEDGQGELIAGQRFSDRAGKDWAPHLRPVRTSGDVALWRTDLQKPLFLAVTSCALRDGPATLYAAYMAFPVPPVETLLSPGVITLALISGLLALWMAVKVSRPLRKLREEVFAISGSPPLLHNVTATGSDEIADVAGAVNRLVGSLRDHIDGMNQLVLNISHELRSPITRMALSAEMIGEGFALLRGNQKDARDEPAVRLAETNLVALRQELEHMDRLIGDTILTSKLEMRDPAELTASVSLSAVCANAAERHDALFRQAGVRFIRGVEENIVVTGDEILLTLVLTNLLDNAVKYASGPEPSARLRLIRDQGMAVLTVENTCSPPLPQDVLDRLFDPYFRHNQRTATGVGADADPGVGLGVGLGLAILKKIVTLHKGAAGAENTDSGIAFRVAFPLGNAR